MLLPVPHSPTSPASPIISRGYSEHCKYFTKLLSISLQCEARFRECAVKCSMVLEICHRDITRRNLGSITWDQWVTTYNSLISDVQVESTPHPGLQDQAPRFSLGFPSLKMFHDLGGTLPYLGSHTQRYGQMFMKNPTHGQLCPSLPNTLVGLWTRQTPPELWPEVRGLTYRSSPRYLEDFGRDGSEVIKKSQYFSQKLGGG